jgi:hypothetical protein
MENHEFYLVAQVEKCLNEVKADEKTLLSEHVAIEGQSQNTTSHTSHE